jgi:hypothetical protein
MFALVVLAGCGGSAKTVDGRAALSCLSGAGNVDVSGADYIALGAPYHALLSVSGHNVNVSVWSSQSDANSAASQYGALGARIERHGTVLLVWDKQPSAALRNHVDRCVSG